MTHEDCMATLLGSPSGRTRRGEAEEHAARCSDCWAVLSLVHELTRRQPPPDAERMGTLFGCGPVQDEMYLVADASPDEIARRHPVLSRHVAACPACRGRLGEILVVERAAARGELGPPLLAATGPRWKEVQAKAGQVVREAVGSLVVRLRHASAVFTAVPDGFLPSPLAPAAVLRGSPGDRPRPDELGLFQQVRFTLVESELWAELTLQHEGGERVGMVVRISSTGRPRVGLHLRELRDDGGDLLARYTLLAGGPVVVKGLVPGRYLLEIEEKQKSRRFQVRFEIEAAA